MEMTIPITLIMMMLTTIPLERSPHAASPNDGLDDALDALDAALDAAVDDALNSSMTFAVQSVRFDDDEYHHEATSSPPRMPVTATPPCARRDEPLTTQTPAVPAADVLANDPVQGPVSDGLRCESTSADVFVDHTAEGLCPLSPSSAPTGTCASHRNRSPSYDDDDDDDLADHLAFERTRRAYKYSGPVVDMD